MAFEDKRVTVQYAPDQFKHTINVIGQTWEPSELIQEIVGEVRNLVILQTLNIGGFVGKAESHISPIESDDIYGQEVFHLSEMVGPSEICDLIQKLNMRITNRWAFEEDSNHD